MFVLPVLVLAVLGNSLANFAPSTSCNLRDEESLKSTIEASWKKIYGGMPELGIECMDPMNIDLIEGNYPTLKFKGTNNTVTGLKDCKVQNIRISNDFAMVQCEINFPRYIISGNATSNGYLLYVPIIGTGQYEVDFENHSVTIYALLHQVKDSDGKIYLQVGEFSLDIKTLGNDAYYFKNFYFGNEILTNAANHFASEHGEKLAYFANEPTWYPIFTKILVNYNKYLLTRPIENVTVELVATSSTVPEPITLPLEQEKVQDVVNKQHQEEPNHLFIQQIQNALPVQQEQNPLPVQQEQNLPPKQDPNSHPVKPEEIAQTVQQEQSPLPVKPEQNALPVQGHNALPVKPEENALPVKQEQNILIQQEQNALPTQQVEKPDIAPVEKHNELAPNHTDHH